MSKAKPYHDLLPHLEDAWRVFRAVWEQNEDTYRHWCEKQRLNPEEVHFLLGLGVWLHDIGKSNPEWQAYLESGEGKTKVSHPLLSFATLWELFDQWEGRQFLKHPLNRAVLTSVLAHHHMLHRTSYDHYRSMKTLHLPADEVNDAVSGYLARQPRRDFRPFSPEQLKWPEKTLPERVKIIRNLIEKLRPAEKILQKALHTFCLSLICLADNASSAMSGFLHQEGRLRQDECSVNQETIRLFARSWIPWISLDEADNPVFRFPNRLQRQVMEKIHPYMVVRAGCGEGKTGAALWFARHWFERKRANRVIFTLPTRFTINSMTRDFLSEKYGLPRGTVGMYHSEAARFLAGMDPHDDAEQPEDTLFRSVEDETFRANFFHPPITVTTVDHLLYSLLHCHKYADRAFGNLQQAVVVFDELHYYQSYTLNKIAECLKLLKRLEIPHLLMSATLPDSFLEKINSRVTPYQIVQSDGKTPDGSRVQTPFVIEKVEKPLVGREHGLSQKALDLIEEHLPLRQMIVVNQVERAKLIARQLMELYPDHNIVCYHSEFSARDRKEKERCIKALFKSVAERSDEERKILSDNGFADEDAVILVATQICELSLDIRRTFN